MSNLESETVNQMVGFVDFPPTALKLAGAQTSEMMEGRNFLGDEVESKEFIYGYRDRADDCYDVAPSVFDGRYLYVRHFMPHVHWYGAGSNPGKLWLRN